MNNENMSSGKGLTLVKTTLLPGQERVTVVASLPTSPSCDVTANISIVQLFDGLCDCDVIMKKFANGCGVGHLAIRQLKC